MASFVFVLLLPLGFIISYLNQHSWDSAKQELQEKHLLIAKSMEKPILQYVDTYQKALQVFLESTEFSSANEFELKSLMNDFVNSLDNVTKYRKYNVASSISDAFRSAVSRKPVVVMSQPIIGNDQNKLGTIFLELELEPIADMCRKIRFGEQGHCAITDKKGHIIAHPDADLEEEMYNISEIGILNKLKETKNGIWSFESPSLKEEMIAGFNTVEGLGWAIIIPQPKSELESPFKAVINTVITWLGVGIIISLLVNSPIEVSILWKALADLVERLHDSNKEVRKLNYSLSKDIEKATAKLRATNLHLYKMSSLDHLTKIANRRYFEDSLNKIFKSQPNEYIGIIVIDVDKFKFINDHYGHEAGDLALKHIANIMKQSTREKDIPARLGGDEFVVYIHNCKDKILTQVAENLRKKVQDQPIEWEGKKIKLSLSVGTVNCHAKQNFSLDQLLKFADEAMYESKEAGRNSVSSYKFKPVSPYQEKLDKIAELERQIKESKIKELKKIIALQEKAKIDALIKKQHNDTSLKTLVTIGLEQSKSIHKHTPLLFSRQISVPHPS